jgi:hypothetical protein
VTSLVLLLGQFIWTLFAVRVWFAGHHLMKASLHSSDVDMQGTEEFQCRTLLPCRHIKALGEGKAVWGGD